MTNRLAVEDANGMNEKVLTNRALSFIEIGVACNAITVLDQSGIVEKLLVDGKVTEDDLVKFDSKKKVLIDSSLKTLCHVEAVSKNKDVYILSDFGYEICNSIPLINMLFVGYGNLFSKQNAIFSGKENSDYYDLDNKAISKGCSGLPVSDLEAELSAFIQTLRLNGVVCDLGCGRGDRLIKLNKLLGVKGLGMDLCAASIKEAKKSVKGNASVNFVVADVRKLNCIWDEVEILMQCFMTHDLSPKKLFLDAFRAYQDAFPNMKYFIILDVFSSNPSEKERKFAPGFDYIHALQGIVTRDYDETVRLFAESGFELERSVKSNFFPNTCLWILKPVKKN